MEPEGGPLGVSDALKYLDAVKARFTANRAVYDRFLGILKDFKTQAIDTPEVIDQVSTLFSGHAGLLRGFTVFLPPGYNLDCTTEGTEIVITTTTPSGTTTRRQQIDVDGISDGDVPDEALNLPTLTDTDYLEPLRLATQYLIKVKTRFEDDPQTYSRFLDTLKAYDIRLQSGDVTAELRSDLQDLFKDAPDLLAEFEIFMPLAARGGARSGFDGAGVSSPLLEGERQEDNNRKAKL